VFLLRGPRKLHQSLPGQASDSAERSQKDTVQLRRRSGAPITSVPPYRADSTPSKLLGSFFAENKGADENASRFGAGWRLVLRLARALGTTCRRLSTMTRAPPASTNSFINIAEGRQQPLRRRGR
jgi:hypothetical protein